MNSDDLIFVILSMIVISVWWHLSSWSERISLSLITIIFGACAYFLPALVDPKWGILFCLSTTAAFTFAAVKLVLIRLKFTPWR
jgi:hypothetical protein